MVHKMNANDELMPVSLIVSPTGGRRTKEDHPNIPLKINEITQEVAACADAGATMVHLHVRRPDGRHLLDMSAYLDAISAIEKAVGDRVLIQITTESLGLYSPAEQEAVLRAVRPPAASLALREFLKTPADEPAFIDLLSWMAREKIVPQIILYDPEEARTLADLRERGVLPWADVPVLLALGRYRAGQTSAPSDLLPFLASDMPRFAHWSVCAFGRRETAVVAGAALMGGHARVGFENNLFLTDGRMADGNDALVRSARTAIEACGLEIGSIGDLMAAFAPYRS